jgi:hypothetical protein
VGLKIKVSRHRAIKAVVGDKSSRAITALAIAISDGSLCIQIIASIIKVEINYPGFIGKNRM